MNCRTRASSPAYVIGVSLNPGLLPLSTMEFVVARQNSPCAEAPVSTLASARIVGHKETTHGSERYSHAAVRVFTNFFRLSLLLF